MTPKTIEEWLKYTADGDAQFVCSWRKRAWRAMRPVIETVARDPSAWSVSRALKALDDAGRAANINPDTKRWRTEYEKIADVLEDDRRLWRVATDDDRGVCAVATDLVELEHYDEALTLLKLQAPHVLDRQCSACNSPAGWACIEISVDEFPREDTPQTAALREAGTKVWSRRSLIVPHEARLQ